MNEYKLNTIEILMHIKLINAYLLMFLLLLINANYAQFEVRTLFLSCDSDSHFSDTNTQYMGQQKDSVFQYVG